jgi:hypothetical protein
MGAEVRQIQVRRDTAANWTSSNPTLAAGEPGYETDTDKIKIGDGSTAWTSLRYAGGVDHQVDLSAATTLSRVHQGARIRHPAADNNARTFTIPANSSVPFPVGTRITFINEINTVTIAINTDTMVLVGAGTTGSRTLAANGRAVAEKVAADRWYISGTGLT